MPTAAKPMVQLIVRDYVQNNIEVATACTPKYAIAFAVAVQLPLQKVFDGGACRCSGFDFTRPSLWH
jgi:hypothetical protein